MAIKKDPNAVLDYTVDWTDWLAPVADVTVSVIYSAATKTARMNAVVTTIGASGKLKLFAAADALLATFPPGGHGWHGVWLRADALGRQRRHGRHPEHHRLGGRHGGQGQHHHIGRCGCG